MSMKIGIVGAGWLGAGCDPAPVGDLGSGRRFQRDGAGFRAHLGRADLRRALGLH